MMCCDVGNRGAAVYSDKVFYATPDAHVIALKRETGEKVWDVTVGDRTKAQTMTVAPLMVKGKVVVGMSGAEYPTRLWIDALDSETGAQVWRRYTIPGPGEPGFDTWGDQDPQASAYGGGSTWITGSYDAELDTLYWSTGNPNPDWDGMGRIGDNLYTNPTLALNPDDGSIKFHYQYTPWDVWDFDVKSVEDLWSYQTGSGIVGSPISFAIDGKQYIAAPSGWGGWTGWATWGGKGGAPHLKNMRKGGTVFVFARFDR